MNVFTLNIFKSVTQGLKIFLVEKDISGRFSELLNHIVGCLEILLYKLIAVILYAQGSLHKQTLFLWLINQ